MLLSLKKFVLIFWKFPNKSQRQDKVAKQFLWKTLSPCLGISRKMSSVYHFISRVVGNFKIRSVNVFPSRYSHVNLTIIFRLVCQTFKHVVEFLVIKEVVFEYGCWNAGTFVPFKTVHEILMKKTHRTKLINRLMKKINVRAFWKVCFKLLFPPVLFDWLCV